MQVIKCKSSLVSHVHDVCAFVILLTKRAIPEKNKTGEVEDIFLSTPGKFQINRSFTLGNSTKMCYYRQITCTLRLTDFVHYKQTHPLSPVPPPPPCS